MSKYIDTNFYVKRGGDIRRPPYIDTVGRGIYTTDYYKVRVFVSDLWYPTWPEWSKAAQIAIDTAIQGTNPVIVQRGISIATAAELEPSPSYIFDHTQRAIGVISILLNAAAIKTEEDYDSIRIIAEARRRVVEKGLAKNASADEYTQYSPAENGTRYIWDEIKDSEAIKNRGCSRLFSKPDPAEEYREKLIQDFMRLDMRE